MKNNKAVSPDNIPIEVWKCLDESGIDIVWNLMRKIACQEKMPSQWQETSIIPLYKKEGDVQQFSNYRGVNLLSHTLKVWKRILLGRIESETYVYENQFGSIRGRQTSDAILA